MIKFDWHLGYRGPTPEEQEALDLIKENERKANVAAMPDEIEKLRALLRVEEQRIAAAVEWRTAITRVQLTLPMKWVITKWAINSFFVILLFAETFFISLHIIKLFHAEISISIIAQMVSCMLASYWLVRAIIVINKPIIWANKMVSARKN